MTNLNVTVYSRPNCQPCKATYRALDKLGLDYYSVVDAAEPGNEGVADALKDRDHLASPVVIVMDAAGEVVDEWSGYRPHRIKEVLA